MGSFRLSLLLLALSSPAFSQPMPSPQAKTYTVAGQVINQLTGAPIPRVLVQLSGKAQLTGLAGEFSFPAIPEGRTQISINKPGYFSAGARSRFNPPLPIGVGADSDKLLLKMVPEAVIVGQVTGDDHEPLEGAQILLLQYSTGGGTRRLSPVAMNARSDEDGYFRVAGLPAGRYFLAVKAGNITRRILGADSAKKNQSYPGILYYPGTPDFAAALPLDLAPAQKFDGNFELNMVPAYKVSGSLISAPGLKQLYPPSIIDATGQQLFSVSAFDAESGHFEFKSLPAGSYRFILRAQGQDDKLFTSTRTVTIARATSDLKLPVRTGTDIPVVIRAEFSKRQTPASCTSHAADGTITQSDCSDFPRAHVELLAPDSVPFSYGSDSGPQKGPPALAIRNVPAGKYVVRARATFGGYVQSIRSGPFDLLREELVVPEDGQVAPIEVVVRDDGGSIQVRLRADSPNQTANVLLLPQFGLAAEPQPLGVASSSAQLQTSALAPGNYKLFAFDPVSAPFGSNVYEDLDKFAAQAASVTVTPNSSTTVLLDVIRGDAR